MRLLVLGASGMLGHKLSLLWRDQFEVYLTVRSAMRLPGEFGFRGRILEGIDAFDLDGLVRAFRKVRPAVVVNCIGIVKQLAAATDPLLSITVNALFPHRLAEICDAAGARLVHVSTDCVFSGHRGRYTESDNSDAEDLYGRTKFLGEVGSPALTLRTSIIGRELSGVSGLVEWFLAQRGRTVVGFRRVVYTGLTTLAFGRVVEEIIQNHPGLKGVYNVASQAITKYDLLRLLNQAYDVQASIEPGDTPVIDRSLDSTRFYEATGIMVPPWPVMINEMAEDPTPYDRWRNE